MQEGRAGRTPRRRKGSEAAAVLIVCLPIAAIAGVTTFDNSSSTIRYAVNDGGFWVKSQQIPSGAGSPGLNASSSIQSGKFHLTASGSGCMDGPAITRMSCPNPKAPGRRSRAAFRQPLRYSTPFRGGHSGETPAGECQDRFRRRCDVHILTVVPPQDRDDLPLQTTATTLSVGRNAIAKSLGETDCSRSDRRGRSGSGSGITKVIPNWCCTFKLCCGRPWHIVSVRN
jgi:hypothetical protein